jgi:hypothetical protein
MPLWSRRRPDAATETFRGFHDLHAIGQGGFSIVYRARHDRLDRTVAVKVLTAAAIDGAARRRFQRELNLASRLAGHPHVVTVIDSGRSSWGRPYLVMDYFERGSLADRVAESGPLSVADVLRFGVKVAGALAAAHQAGMLHRDVKPQNILVSRYGEPALADFGTAQLTGSFEVSMRTEALTPFHAAPELLQGGQASPVTDVYSLGSTLYQLLTGAPPYQTGGRGIAGLLLAVLAGEPAPITRTDVPAGLTAALQRAMAAEPADRIPDAAGFAAALQDVQASLGLPVTELPRLGATPAPIAPTPPAAITAPMGVASRGPSGVSSPESLPVPLDLGEETVKVRPATAHGRRRWLIGAGIAIVVVVAMAAPLLLARAPKPRTTAATGPVPSSTAATAHPTTPAAHPTTPPATPTAPPPAPAAPTVVTDGGATVTLRWRLAAAAIVYPVLVQITPAGKPSYLDLPQPAGTTTFTVAGLDPATGYCFQIGLLLTIGSGGQPSNVTMSGPTCIRGAHAG